MSPEVSFASAPVPADLAPYVRSLHGARLRGGAPGRQLELPVAGTAVIVELTARWGIAVCDGAPLVRHRSFAGGLTLGPAVSAHRGAYELVEFVLTPLGTSAILGLPPVVITDEVVALDAVLGPEAERLGERLAACAEWEARFAVTARWLRARIAAARELVSPEIGWAIRRLDATGGRLPIGELQRELGCSRRHLSARFAAGVGVTPKRYAQLVRFGDAVTRLRAGDAPGEVAAMCGYTDQAHLSREVRRFGSTTPGALAAGT